MAAVEPRPTEFKQKYVKRINFKIATLSLIFLHINCLNLRNYIIISLYFILIVI